MRSRPLVLQAGAWALAIIALTACGDGMGEARDPAGTEPSRTPSEEPVADLPVGAATSEEQPSAAGKATLNLASRPPGAVVYGDGKELGTTPIEAAEIEAGHHTVRLAVPEHAARVLEVDVRGGEVLKLADIALDPWGTLAPGRLDDGVTAWIGEDRLVDARPTSPDEDVEVSFRREGHANQYQMIRVPLATAIHVEPDDWSKYQGRLDLTALDEQGITCLVDGQPVSGVVTYAAATELSLELMRSDRATQSVRVHVTLGSTTQPTLGEWEASACPFAVVICADVSGSIGDARLPEITACLVDVARALRPGERLGVLAFSDRATWRLPLGEVPESTDLRTCLDDLPPPGTTRLRGALEAAYEALSNTKARQRCVILISDGMTEPERFRPLIEGAAQRGITLSAIAYGAETDDRFLGRLSQWGNGRLYLARDDTRLGTLGVTALDGARDDTDDR